MFPALVGLWLVAGTVGVMCVILSDAGMRRPAEENLALSLLMYLIWPVFLVWKGLPFLCRGFKGLLRRDS